MLKIRQILCCVMVFAGSLCGQQPQTSSAEALRPLSFLEGTWEAKAVGDATPRTIGTYSFVRELGGHVLARHSMQADCKASAAADCDHRDLLYIYPSTEGHGIKAIYFDSEGHVIQYTLAVLTLNSVVFGSDPSTPGPRYRLVYSRSDNTLSGKFQVFSPDASDWKSYMEWTGDKK